MSFRAKCSYFGFVHMHPSTSASFRGFNVAKRVDVVNVIGKSVKKSRKTCIKNSP